MAPYDTISDYCMAMLGSAARQTKALNESGRTGCFLHWLCFVSRFQASSHDDSPQVDERHLRGKSAEQILDELGMSRKDMTVTNKVPNPDRVHHRSYCFRAECSPAGW